MPAPAPIRACLHLERAGFNLDVTLELPGLGVSTLFGPSGSGKTTVLRCLAGLERAPGGLVDFQGTIWQDGNHFLPVHRRGIGYVFQEAALFAHLDVLSNLRYGARRRGTAQQGGTMDEIIALLDLAHLMHRHIRHLSGGERQRVAIGRALATSPRLLLMDEPLANLDRQRKLDILPYLDRLHETLRIPIVYISHDLDEVARLSDHLVLLRAGRVVQQGPLFEVLPSLEITLLDEQEASVVLQACVVERDSQWQLARLDFAGGSLWARDHGIPVGSQVRMRLLARDVSLSLEKMAHSSMLNSLPGRAMTIVPGRHPGLCLVQVQVGDALVLAQVTRRSAAELNIAPGMALWVNIKSVALLEQPPGPR